MPTYSVSCPYHGDQEGEHLKLLECPQCKLDNFKEMCVDDKLIALFQEIEKLKVAQ